MADKPPTERVRKKRKWDVAADGEAAPADPLVAAAEAQRQINEMLAHQAIEAIAEMEREHATTDPPIKPVSLLQAVESTEAAARGDDDVMSKDADAEGYSEQIPINDCRAPVRALLTRGAVHREIYEQTKTTVTTRGRYRPPGAPAGGEDLYLLLSAPSAAELEEGVQAVRQIMDGAARGEAPGHEKSRLTVAGKLPSIISCEVYARIRAPDEFGVADKLAGEAERENFKFIEKETGCGAILRGRGSEKGSDYADFDMPLQIVLSGRYKDWLEVAAGMARSLCDTIREEAEEFIKEHPQYTVPDVPMPAALPVHLQMVSLAPSTAAPPRPAPVPVPLLPRPPTVPLSAPPAPGGFFMSPGYPLGMTPGVPPSVQPGVVQPVGPVHVPPPASYGPPEAAAPAPPPAPPLPDSRQVRRFQEAPVAAEPTLTDEPVGPRAPTSDEMDMRYDEEMPPPPPVTSSPSVPSTAVSAAVPTRPPPEAAAGRVLRSREPRIAAALGPAGGGPSASAVQLVSYGEEDAAPTEAGTVSDSKVPFWQAGAGPNESPLARSTGERRKDLDQVMEELRK